MQKDLVRKILDTDNRNMYLLADKAMELYGVDLRDTAQIRAFLKTHPNFQLPDVYMHYGNSREIYISHHDPVYNGLVHAHDFFEMIYVARGSVVDEIDGTDILLKEGEICIHNPNALHMIQKCGEEDLLINILISRETFRGFVYYNVFRDKGLEGFFDQYLQSSTSPHYLVFHDTGKEVRILTEMLLEEYFHEEKSEMLLNATLLLLFGNLLRTYHLNTKDDEILEYINENLSEVTLASASEHFHYHPKYFSALLRKKTGKNFKTLVIEMRLRRATYYLKYTDMSVERIAGAIGYVDPSAFYTGFEKAYHMTPGQYRENAAGIMPVIGNEVQCDRLN